MTTVTEMPSNSTGLRIAAESSFKTLPGTQVWYPKEPNEYSDFGANIAVTPRKPITADRQRRKGVITDLDVPAGYSEDLTYSSTQRLIEGFLFAAFREKGVYGTDSLSGIAVSGITTADDTYTVASGGSSCDANDLVFGKGFANAANNGLHTVASSTGTTIVVDDNLTDETPAAAATLTRVGHEFATGDAEIVASGSAFPTLITTTKDLTELDLVPGEWIFIGGDATGEKFATAANNGRARIRSIATNTITFDKTEGTMVTDDGAAKTIRIFFGRVCKNESTANLIIKKFYQLERILGAPDDANPGDEQAEYVVGASPDELVINWPTSEIITTDLTFMGAEHETRAATSPGLKSGTRPALVAEDAFNASNHAQRISLQTVHSTDSNPGSLFSFISEMTLTVKNNVQLNKAIGTLGGFASNAGAFEVTAEVTAYFATVAGLAAKRNNDDITLDAHLADQNRGIAFDIPLLAMADGLPEIESDEAIKLPLTNEAASGVDVDSNLNHTLMVIYYDYLPDAAEA